MDITTKEKARALVQLYFNETNHMEWDEAKACALICVKEIIESLPKLVAADGMGSARFDNPQIDRWKRIKKHIKDQ